MHLYWFILLLKVLNCIKSRVSNSHQILPKYFAKISVKCFWKYQFQKNDIVRSLIWTFLQLLIPKEENYRVGWEMVCYCKMQFVNIYSPNTDKQLPVFKMLLFFQWFTINMIRHNRLLMLQMVPNFLLLMEVEVYLDFAAMM